MKTILAIGLMSFSLIAGASSEPLVTCHSQEDNLTLCVYDLTSGDWRSVLITWSHAATCAGDPMQITYSRQFVQNEVRYLKADGIEAYQNNRFLGLGSKTQFSLDREAGTAIVSGKNGGSLAFQTEPGAPSERQGKYYMEFSDCH